ncbi:MAG: hypothetical protein LLF86_09335 [Nitrospiraceae bacterium]|nr:hypothetical protein [Nitrospiraceae bacterium]
MSAQTAATMAGNPFASGSALKGGPLPAPNMDGLDDYQKQLAFASRNIEEGDWAMAEQNLDDAEKLRNDDPRLYEMKGIVYSADRESLKAYASFKKAADMYLLSDNIDKSWRMLGWLRTLNMETQAVDKFERSIRERQLAINQAK